MPRTELDNAADELYSAPREDFIALRKQLAKSARESGDVDAAAEIEKLAKPTTAAWLANQLARTDAEDVRALAELGDAMRDAHEQLAGADLKSLSQQRTELIRSLVQQAGSHGSHALSESVTRELEEIFTAVVADEDAARALVAGRLTSAKGFALTSGWPAMAGGEPAARPRQPARSTAKPRSDRRSTGSGETAEQAQRARRLEKAQLDLEDARAAVKEAEAARAEDERALADAEAVVSDATAEVTRLTDELDAAEAREKRARGQAAQARRSVKEAERRAGHAWRQVQQAERKLSELKED